MKGERRRKGVKRGHGAFNRGSKKKGGALKKIFLHYFEGSGRGLLQRICYTNTNVVDLAKKM